VIDRTQPLSGNRMFPRGTLREPLSSLSRAHLIVLNGMHPESMKDPEESLLRRFRPDAVIFHCRQKISRLVSLPAWQNQKDEGAPSADPASAFLVAAIGNPHRFRADVEALGIRIKGERFFRDHFTPGRDGWRDCIRQARSLGAGALITTEKDAVKLGMALDFPVLVAVQSTELTEQEQLKQMLRQLMEARQ